MHTVEEFAVALTQSLTPSNQVLAESEVQLTALSFGAGLVNEAVQKNGWGPEVTKSAGEFFTSLLFTNSLSFGTPKQPFEPTRLPQVVYSAAAVSTYCQWLLIHVEGLQSLATQYLQVVMGILQGTVSQESFQTEAYAFAGYLTTIQILAAGIDLEVPLIPPEFQVPPLKAHIEQMVGIALRLIQAGDKVRVAYGNRQPSNAAEQEFAQVYQELLGTLPRYSQIFMVLQQQIAGHFTALYPEEDYTKWQLYTHEFAKVISDMAMLSFGVGLSDPYTFQVLLQVLEKFTGFAFDIISPVLTLVRFRGHLDDFLKKSKDAHQQISAIFTPLLQSIVNTMPKIAVGLQGYYNTKIAPLFETMQRLHGEYPARLEELLTAMKKDRRWSVFTTIGRKRNSEVTEAAKQAIETTSKLVIQLLKYDASQEEIYATVQALYTQFQEFVTFMVNYTAKEQDQERKIHLIHQKDAIHDAMTMFAGAYEVYNMNAINPLVKTKAGIAATNLCLSFCSLDTHPVLLKQLGISRQGLAENVVQFFPTNIKLLIEILHMFFQRNADLEEEPGQIFVAIWSLFMASIKDSKAVFDFNGNPSNPENVIACIRECDKIQAILRALYSALAGTQMPPDLNSALGLLEAFGYDVRYSAECLRLALQLNYRQAIETFADDMEPFVEMVASVATLQSEEYYQNFMKLKESILASVHAITDKLKVPPPHGIYDQSFLMELVLCSREAFTPTITLIRECQEILKLATSPAQIKSAINSISQTLNLLSQMLPYVNAIYYEHKLPLPELLGFLLKNNTTDIREKIGTLSQQLQTDSSQISGIGGQLVGSLYDFAESLAYVDQLKKTSEDVKGIARKISNVTGHISLGDTSLQGDLVSLLQNILGLSDNLKPIIDQYIAQVREHGKRGQEEMGVRRVQLAPGQLAKPDGSKWEGLVLEHLPQPDELARLFEQISALDNEELKKILLGHFAQLQQDVQDFAPLYEAFTKDPSNQELLMKLNDLGARIIGNQNTIEAGLNLAACGPTRDQLASLMSNFQAMSAKDKAAAAPQLLMNMAAYLNSYSNDPVMRAVINAVLDSIRNTMATDPEAALKQLESLGLCLGGDPNALALGLFDPLRGAIAQGDQVTFLDLGNRLLLADRIAKAMAGMENPLDDESSVQSAIAKAIADLSMQQGISPEMSQQLDKLLRQFENLLTGKEEEEELPEEEEIDDADIADRISDLSTEITTLGAGLVTELKKATEADKDRIMENINTMKFKSLDVATAVAVAASKREKGNADLAADLQEEIEKLLKNLDAFTEEADKSISGAPNKAALLRAAGKSNREITINLDKLSEICDQIIELPKAAQGQQAEDYHTKSNVLLADLMKAMKLSLDADSKIKDKMFIKLQKGMNLDLSGFTNSIAQVTTGVDEDFGPLLADLESKMMTLAVPACELKYEAPKSAFTLVSEIRRCVAEALNTDVVPQPAAVSALPFRFAVPAMVQVEPKPLQEIKPIIDTTAQQAVASLQTLIGSLNNPKTAADVIHQNLLNFHSAISNLIHPTSIMRASTWNPQCQSKLSVAYSGLISVGDSAIDAARVRLLGTDGWRDQVAKFMGIANEGFSATVAAAEAAIKAAESDLAVTNEAERELVAAARSVAASQQRLAQFKTTAAEKKIAIGEGYIGCDIIDISAPILNTAANLIEAAQRQTKFLLSRDPNLPNTKGLVKTARDLVDSLELILVAAESTVNNEPDAISKVLGSCNLISSAVAHFLAECYQKNGSPELNDVMTKITDSIQGLIKQLRAFGEAAQQSKTERETAAAPRPSGRQFNAMIEKLNAEAKVVEARRALEEAELKLKRTRVGK